MRLIASPPRQQTSPDERVRPRHPATTLVAFGALLGSGGSVLAADPLIWVEGEAAAEHNMERHGWYDGVKKPELSGDQWLSHFAKGEPPVARYEFEAQTAGDHVFWLRANPAGKARLAIRLNDGAWQTIDLGKKEQNTNIAADGKPDLRYVAWIDAGKLALVKGTNAMEVRFESDNNRHGGLDCFVLSPEPFFPQGRRKPGEKTGLADPGTWAFEPDRDRFSPEALLDLSDLNPKPAGRDGRIRRSEDGADFVDGAGQPIRFWAINTGVQSRGDLATLREHARWMAKRGVNMVRHHGHLPPGEGSKLTDVNQDQIDKIWQLVAAMREQGIYTTVSPYWASHTKVRDSWGLKEDGIENMTGLLFFDARVQEAYKSWLRALLTPENPHTGIPLAKDPALALFQIQNEDSLLFWTESSIQGEARTELGRQFYAWLEKRYGSIEGVHQAWGGTATNKHDNLAEGLFYPHIIWHLTQEQPKHPGLKRRLNDQLAFYTELMANWNAEVQRFLREEIGYEGLINAGNWKTTDQARLLDAERLAYRENDVIGVNRYYNGGFHVNPSEKHRAGYMIARGDRFDADSALRRPWAFPLALRQVAGHPMIISESSWVPPLRYQSEGPFLVAAYGSLTGFDIYYWFATGEIGFGEPMGKWQLSTPAQLGMFPAASWLFRQGLVEKGSPILREHRPVTDVFSRKPPLLPEEAGFDPNRDGTPFPTTAQAQKAGRLSPMSYLIGPVEVSFAQDTNPAENEIGEIERFLDESAHVVRSQTGQLAWHYEHGYATLSAPQAQGATGRLPKEAPLSLGALKLTSSNDYSTVLAVSLDGKPLEASTKVLLQIGTVARPYGWKTKPAPDGKGKEIVELGSAPWNLLNTKLQARLANPDLSRATLLDANFLAERELELSHDKAGIVLQLPEDAMYVLLR